MEISNIVSRKYVLGDKFVDMQIMSSDGKILLCHKLILAELEYFERILYDYNKLRANAFTVNVPYDIVSAVLEYLYHGYLKINNIPDIVTVYRFAKDIQYDILCDLILQHYPVTPVEDSIKGLLEMKILDEQKIMAKINDICGNKEQNEKLDDIQKELDKYSYGSIKEMTFWTSSQHNYGDKYKPHDIYFAFYNEDAFGYRKMRPFLKHTLYKEFPWINDSNIGKLFTKYYDSATLNIYLMCWPIKSAGRDSIYDCMFSRANGANPPDYNHPDIGHLINWHCDRLLAREYKKIELKYNLI